LFCSVPKFFFPGWAGFLFILLCTAHPTTNVQHPLESPTLPATEYIPAQTPPTGATPPAHVGARTPAATHKHTRSLPRTKHLRRSRHRRRRAIHLSSPPSPARPHKHAEPMPAIPTPAATRPARFPPRARAAGLADTGGGAETSERLPCPPPPQICTGAAGHTDAGGTPSCAMPALSTRRRSGRRRRRNKIKRAPPLPAAPPDTHRCRRPHKRRRQHAPHDARFKHAPPVLPTPAAKQKQVCASLDRRLPQRAQAPLVTQTPAATRPARCPPRASAAGLADAGGRTKSRKRLPCRLPPLTRTGAAGHTDAGGNLPRTMPAPSTRHRSCRRWRRNKNN